MRARSPIFVFAATLYAIAISLPLTGGAALCVPIFAYCVALFFKVRIDEAGLAHIRFLARTSMVAFAFIAAVGVTSGIVERMQEPPQDLKSVVDNAIVGAIFVSAAIWYVAVIHGLVHLLKGQAPSLGSAAFGWLRGVSKPARTAPVTNSQS